MPRLVDACEQLLCHGEPRLQSVLVKAVTHPCAAEVRAALPLQLLDLRLCSDGDTVKDRVRISVLAEHLVLPDFPQRVQRYQHRLLPRQRLQTVDQVVQADRVRVGASEVLAAGLVVPRRPRTRVARQHRGVGMQHRPVGVVPHGAQCRTLGRAGIVQQAQRLVAMGGEYDTVEVFTSLCGVHDHATCIAVALDRQHRRAQAFVGNAGDDFVDIVARAAFDGPPLRPVADLVQAMVVAKADHRGNRELQHLRHRATPDAGHHRQEIPFDEGVAEPVLLQEVTQRLLQLPLLSSGGNGLRQSVEPAEIAQHAQKTRAEQVAPLREHAAQIGAAPFDMAAAARICGLDRERHVRGAGRNVQFGKQGDQRGIGAFVEYQEAGINPMADRQPIDRQTDVDGVGMPAEVIGSLEQGDPGVVDQTVRDGQTRNAGTDDGDSHAGLRWVARLTDKIAAKHPRVNKGEEENDPVVATDRRASVRLRSSKPVRYQVMRTSVWTRSAADKFPGWGGREARPWATQL